MSYKLGKLTAEYDMLFKTLPPEWHCSFLEKMWRLQKALGKPSPYLTDEENMKYETKLKVDYAKKFGSHIRKLEVSLAYIRIMEHYYTLEINRTGVGAFAFDPRYHRGRELNYEDWLDVVKGFGDCYYDSSDYISNLMYGLMGDPRYSERNSFHHGHTMIAFYFSDSNQFSVHSTDTNWYRWKSYLYRLNKFF